MKTKKMIKEKKEEKKIDEKEEEEEYIDLIVEKLYLITEAQKLKKNTQCILRI